jgi:hypothetical protein
MTGPASQSGLPGAAAAAAAATDADDELRETTRDSDGVPVGQADAEADRRRAESERD